MNIPCKFRPIGNGGLPPGYTHVEYLESTGTQYVMTGFFPDDTAEIKIDITPRSAPQNLGVWIFANANKDRTEGGRSLKGCVVNSGTQGHLYYEYGSRLSDGGVGLPSPVAPSLGERRIIELKNGYYDTGSAKGSFTKQSFSTDLVELSIFRNIRDTTVTVVDIYSCALTKNGKLERDFVPMLDSTGTPCMYDLVSKTPYYDAGTSAVPFTVGLTKVQAETLVLGKKASGLTIAVPADTDLTVVEANNPGITLTIQITD